MPMTRSNALRDFTLRRLLLMLPTLLGITFLVFLLCQFVPGGPIDQMRMRIAGAEGFGETGAGASQRVSSIDIPARQAFVVEMVGQKDIQNAVALNSLTFNLARIGARDSGQDPRCFCGKPP